MRPATFGRREPQITPHQIRARAAAGGSYGLFIVSLFAGCTTDNAGLAVWLIVLAFGALLAGMAAASDA